MSLHHIVTTAIAAASTIFDYNFCNSFNCILKHWYVLLLCWFSHQS